MMSLSTLVKVLPVLFWYSDTDQDTRNLTGIFGLDNWNAVLSFIGLFFRPNVQRQAISNLSKKLLFRRLQA